VHAEILLAGIATSIGQDLLHADADAAHAHLNLIGGSGADCRVAVRGGGHGAVAVVDFRSARLKRKACFPQREASYPAPLPTLFKLIHGIVRKIDSPCQIARNI
jgi:hypothetical protein